MSEAGDVDIELLWAKVGPALFALRGSWFNGKKPVLGQRNEQVGSFLSSPPRCVELL